MGLGTPENSAIKKLSFIIIILLTLLADLFTDCVFNRSSIKMEITNPLITPVKEATLKKSNRRKNGNYNRLFGYQLAGSRSVEHRPLELWQVAGR